MKVEPKIKNSCRTAELEDQSHLTPSPPPPLSHKDPTPQLQILVSENCALANTQESLSGDKSKWEKTFWTGIATSYAHRSPIKALKFTSCAVGEGKLAYTLVTGP